MLLKDALLRDPSRYDLVNNGQARIQNDFDFFAGERIDFLCILFGVALGAHCLENLHDIGRGKISVTAPDEYASEGHSVIPNASGRLGWQASDGRIQD